MTKSKIKINEETEFTSQHEAREFLRKIVSAGVLFVVVHDKFKKTIISIKQTSYYQTITEAHEALQRFVDAGILFVEVGRDK